MIKVKQLCRQYGDVKAVDSVSFTIGRGEVIGLLGHNGAGKTTIMKMLTGYLEPTSGSIMISGLDIHHDIHRIQQHIGYLPENCPVWPEMTVIDYLLYQAKLHGVAEDQQYDAVVRAIQRTDLKRKASQPIHTLSRGYRQRAGVAQAILHDPDIIILDEPTNGLDPTQIKQMRSLINELAQSATIIISTHILQEVQAVCERVLIIRDGRLVVDSRLDALQTGGQLLLRIDNREAEGYLLAIEGVEAVSSCEPDSDQAVYLLTAPASVAPRIAEAVHHAHDKLYQLQVQQRNLENIFAEATQEAA